MRTVDFTNGGLPLLRRNVDLPPCHAGPADSRVARCRAIHRRRCLFACLLSLTPWGLGFTALSLSSEEPYFWQTWWFQSLAGLAVCGTAFVWYFHRMAGLEKKRAAQEAFTRQLLHSQENERKRVASELHDGLGQDLLLIKNRLNLLAAGSNHTPEVARQLAEISASATQAIADVRTISHALRPSALEQVGFTKAIEWMVEQIAEASGIRFSTELDEIDGLLGSDQEINLYRIVQEGLNNVIKHSQASQVILEIKREPVSISVSLFDNGRGFDPELTGHNGVARPSFGLTGIRERAKVLGGFVILQSAPGSGTRLTLNVPLGKNGK